MKYRRQTKESPRAANQARRLLWLRIRALLAAGVVVGLGASATLAAWVDHEHATSTVTSGTFGIVSRAGTGAFSEHESPQTALVVPLEATGLYPGQSRAALVQIQANGSVPGTVNITAASATDAAGNPLGANAAALRDALSVGVRVTSSTSANPPTCTTATTPDATVMGIGNLPTLPAVSLEANGGNTVSYCIIVTLNPSAPNNVQGQEVRAQWTFTGTSG